MKTYSFKAHEIGTEGFAHDLPYLKMLFLT